MRLAPEYENVFLTEIELINKCNYRCAYCTPAINQGKDLVNYKDILWYFDELKRTELVKDRVYSLRLAGGEPTFHPDIDILLKELHKRGVKTHFLTNASRTIEWWSKNQKYLSGSIISIHPQYAKMEHIAGVCKTFDNDKPVYVQAMIDPTRWDTSIDNAKTVYSYLKHIPNCIVVRKPIDKRWEGPKNTPISMNFKDDPDRMYRGVYSPNQKNFLMNWDFADDEELYQKNKKHVLNIDKNLVAGPIYFKDEIKGIKKEYKRMTAKLTGENNFYQWLCNAGVDGNMIKVQGNIYRSACTMPNKIGNMKERVYNRPINGIICDKKACFCLTDLQFRKYAR